MTEPLLGKPRQAWRGTAGVLALVCTFTAFLTFKPSEPYLVVFLNCVRGVPHSTIIDSIFPAWTYAQLALLPLLATASELIGYRFVVLCGMAGRNATLLILIFGGSSVALLTLSEVTIAAGFAAHPALVAILFRSLPPESYARAVGMVSASGVAAEVLSSLLGQLMVNQRAPLLYTVYISAGSTALATLLALLLPSPRPAERKKARHAGGLGVGIGPPQLPPVGSLDVSRDSLDRALLDRPVTRAACVGCGDEGTAGLPAAPTSRVEAVGVGFRGPGCTACCGACGEAGAGSGNSRCSGACCSEGCGVQVGCAGGGVNSTRASAASEAPRRPGPLPPMSPPLHDALLAEHSCGSHDVHMARGGSHGTAGRGGGRGVLAGAGPVERSMSGGGAAGGGARTEVSRRHIVSDVFRAFSRSGALKYYAWLAVATAVHHLVYTYWQALKGMHGQGGPYSPPPPPVGALLSGATQAGARLNTSEPPLPRTPAPPLWPASLPLAPPWPPSPPSPVHQCGVASRHNGWVSLAASLFGGAASLLPLMGERHAPDWYIWDGFYIWDILWPAPKLPALLVLPVAPTWAVPATTQVPPAFALELSESRCASIRAGLVILAPLLLALLLYTMAVSATHGARLAWAYDSCFVSYHVLHELMRVVCDAEGARCVARTSYRGAPRFALVGGLATTATLFLQSGAQMLVSKPGLGLPLDLQFKVLAGMLLLLFLGCAAGASYKRAAVAFGWECACCAGWSSDSRITRWPAASLPHADGHYLQNQAADHPVVAPGRSDASSGLRG